MPRLTVAAVSWALLCALACGGGKNPSAPNNPNPGASGAGTMSATIDGSAWSAISVNTGRTTGTLTISGSDVQRTMTISFARNTSGNQTLGATPIVLGIVIIGGQSWTANASGTGSGTATLTTYSANRAVGTFTLTAVGGPGASPASRQITSGRFDVTY